EDREQRRLAASRGSRHRDVLAAIDVEREPVERTRFFVGVPFENLGDPVEPDQRQARIRPCFALRAVPASFPPGHRPSATECTVATEDRDHAEQVPWYSVTECTLATEYTDHTEEVPWYSVCSVA